jgi:hypothetical protein
MVVAVVRAVGATLVSTAAVKYKYPEGEQACSARGGLRAAEAAVTGLACVFPPSSCWLRAEPGPIQLRGQEEWCGQGWS